MIDHTLGSEREMTMHGQMIPGQSQLFNDEPVYMLNIAVPTEVAMAEVW
jgi:hypothetical protein